MSEENKESRITEEQVRSLLAVDNQVWTFSDGKMAKWFMTASSALRQYLDDLERKSETDVRMGEFMEQAIHDFEMRCDDEAVSVLRKICDIASGKNSCGGGGSCAHCTMKSGCSRHKKEGSSQDEGVYRRIRG